ncbi:hypothetical protein CAI21_04165 [Alkalilimnicola ehrlichii]|uniref:Flagellar protein FliL n=1 Tax=Alkalilimnicola ehrlichii TaxID=351052 RepID=A0A3E0X1I1_9GAMM|nr:flagellar basal body-associated FliL family protein [Alkalilimnicola ehrlichii]RFA30712.1 hypothetical protein CAI21_04165 [Alkalilimnicola ehrlichii]RFA38289.1 hypothetical protein CAL65_05530 [Alkalilimnicola ehrlichii]
MARFFLLSVVSQAIIVAIGVGALYVLLKPEPTSAYHEATLGQVEYDYFPVERIIVSLPSNGRERYFVLDLMLVSEQADNEAEQNRVARVEPLVRNSVISYLSDFQFEELRAIPVAELQQRLEQALLRDFREKRVATPFDHVLISKILVQ